MELYSLIEVGRRIQRSLVWTSNRQWSLQNMAPASAEERETLWHPECRHAGGDMMEGIQRRADKSRPVGMFGRPAQQARDSFYSSLVICRTLTQDPHRPPERLLPAVHLQGLLPQVSAPGLQD